MMFEGCKIFFFFSFFFPVVVGFGRCRAFLFVGPFRKRHPARIMVAKTTGVTRTVDGVALLDRDTRREAARGRAPPKLVCEAGLAHVAVVS